MTEYEKAIEAHNAAQAAYRTVRDAYRNREIGDAEFITAKKAYEAATAVFDKAFAKAANY